MTDRDNNADITTETVIDDYDSPWKDVIEHYLPEFMAFYFPAAFTEIDWSKEPVFLDQELRAVVRDAELGKRFVDKLVRVVLLNGDEKWIYLHIEVQGSRQTEFAERMFVYNYRIYDRYRRPIASMAVLADEHTNWRPDYFSYRVLGSETSIRFPIAKLTDYHNQLDELQTSDNSFAIVTATHILTQRTRKNDYERYQAKRLLVRLLYQRMWDKQRVIDLFYMIDWMMRLPEQLEQQLWLEIETIEENKNMHYVTSVERIGIAKGRQEGRDEGRQEGRQEAEIEMLSIMLKHRFGDLPDTIQNKLKQVGEDQLKKWLINAISAPTLDAVFNDDMTH
ncbi:MAG: cytosolic protein [Planctomycetes bacterium]|nr:cytosolic protein [Planctomycetota bacterium]